QLPEVHCRASLWEEEEMADKPSKGLADVVAASTALSDIDGQAGRLFYRGYDIHQLAGSSTFEEIPYLLQRGSAPSADAQPGSPAPRRRPGRERQRGPRERAEGRPAHRAAAIPGRRLSRRPRGT